MGASPRTIRQWFASESGILHPSLRVGEVTMLSFRDVAEAYVITLLTKFYRFRLTDVREMIDVAKRVSGFRRPLVEADLKMLSRSLVLEIPKRGRHPREAINLSGYENLVFPKLVDQLGKRIVRDRDNGPLRIYPWRLVSETDESRPVSLDPEIVSGRLVVTGTRNPVRVLAGKRLSGSSDEQIVRSYRIAIDSMQKALQHIERPIHNKAA